MELNKYEVAVWADGGSDMPRTYRVQAKNEETACIVALVIDEGHGVGTENEIIACPELAKTWTRVTSTEADREYYMDYPSEPIGEGNPYHRCAHCKVSAPQINGRLEGHRAWCPYVEQHS